MVQHKKIIGISAGAVTALLIISGGFWWFHRSQPAKTIVSSTAATTADTAADAAGSLSVSSGSSTENLGQLDTGQSGSQDGTSSGGSSASALPSVDPSTFAQYEKYKDNNGALFGDVKAGTGATLGNGQQAAVYYKGWLTNGQLFDETRADASGQMQPFLFTLGANKVIPGFEQGVAGMKVGGTRLVIVPSAYGYGSQAQNGIPANSMLIFEIQLIAVQ